MLCGIILYDINIKWYYLILNDMIYVILNDIMIWCYTISFDITCYDVILCVINVILRWYQYDII